MKVVVIGGGYIGSVITGVLLKKELQVDVVEKDLLRLNKLNCGESPVNEPELDTLIKRGYETKKLRAFKEIKDVETADVVIVTVGTPMNSAGNIDLTHLENVFLEISEWLKSEPLVILKSTVEPGTSVYLYNNFLRNLNNNFTFSPERLSEGNAIYEFENLPIVVGGINQSATDKSLKFWNELGFKTIEVSSCTVAEMVKLSDNAWIDLNIAFAHEIAKICDQLEIDVLEVIHAANTLKKGSSFVNILTPSIGVGGYCLTKDPIFLSNMAKSFGIDLSLTKLARKINDQSPEYLVNKLLSKINNLKPKILILGIAFKNDTGDIRFSPVITFFNLLRQKNYNVKWYDAMIEQTFHGDLENMRLHSIAYENKWDVIVIGAHHQNTEFSNVHNIRKLLKPRGIIVDGRKFYSKQEIKYLNSVGIEYIGVGRS